MKLELAILKLNESQQFDQIVFWGKIEGISRDYYIVVGLKFRQQYEFPHKTFFWCNEEFRFAELPPINREHKDKVDGIRTLFSGDHTKVLIKVVDEDDPNRPPDVNPDQQADVDPEKKLLEDTDDEKELKVTPKNFTELDRLAYVIRAIDIDCSVIPVGAFRLTPNHELRYNDEFRGLSIPESENLHNYMHFRNPQTIEKQEYIAREEALFFYDFLDPIDKDLPYGCWALHKDASKTIATIRSLLWPGYIAYHRANSNIFGGVYIGNGIKNVDLPFLL
eukprot:TRINITY_DN6833_c0_g1_i1.p1 TRINITY_DN6833_c0_g1~~TRINITY_DN6833_c0_g1_i1.p1  ORF type:complete len:278 (+),score=92.85 TRINITY_DN6833_c0_g1_i1:173-1006(+)